MSRKDTLTEEQLEELRALLPPGTTVYCILRRVARSGMMRVIDPIVCTPDGPRFLRWAAHCLTGEQLSRTDEGIRMVGTGMDMGFALVYDMSHRLYPDGFACIGDRCPSNDHSNGDRDRTPHHHTSGGYALRKEWL